MKSRWRLLATITSFVMCLPSLAADTTTDGVSYVHDVRPVLSDHCFACHGPDERTREADLRLDLIETAIERGTIVPGKPNASELLARMISDDPDQRMPPPAVHKELSPLEIETIGSWIRQGAQHEQHWSYRPLSSPPIPPVDHSRVRNPIDAFIIDRLESEGFDLSPQADKTTLVRRLYLDLVGVPPTYQEVQEFVLDSTEGAWDRLVDRLLGDQRFGERMAVYWLDLVRYADTIGYHSDNRREVSAYRDYVIDAFNQNLPFNQFTIEQLAGDLLPEPTVEQKIASGYNRLLQTTAEGGAQAKEYIAIYAADRVRNVSAVWLGQTVGCAQCHDHKYDPITTRDFYSLAAFFADLKETPVGRQPPNLTLATVQQQQQVELLEQAVERAKAEQEKEDSDEAKDRVKAAEQELKAFRGSIRTMLISESIEQPRMTRILPRGNWLDESGDVVEPAVPQFLPQRPISDRRANRLDLAQWIVDDQNPLTARTFANRLWKLFHGHGLSRNLEDLGGQGEAPTHPELLDWLSAEFRESGWDVKELVRLMVTSSTYRQTSTPSPELKQEDPDNRLWARQSRWRIEAEFIRDTALALGGLLADEELGGVSVKPYQPAGYWQHLNFPPRKWQADQGAKLYRRSLYTFWCRTFPHPSLIAFDAPSREECTAERARSNIPQQALVLLNDPIFLESARMFASRILASSDSTSDRIRWAFSEACSRFPSDEEIALLTELLADQWNRYQASPKDAQQLLTVGEAPVTNGVDLAELAAWTQVSRAILNAYETTARF